MIPLRLLEDRLLVKIVVHPVADEFPLMEGEAFDALVKDVKANGLVHSVKLWAAPDGGPVYLVDGRNRLRAWETSGRTDCPSWSYLKRANTEAVMIYQVISLNIHRRHLNASQRAMMAARLLPVYSVGKGTRTDLQPPANWPEVEQGKEARELAAKAAKVSPRSVQRAKTVINSGDPELIASVDNGEVAVSKAAKLVRQKTKEQSTEVASVPPPDDPLGEVLDSLPSADDLLGSVVSAEPSRDAGDDAALDDIDAQVAQQISTYKTHIANLEDARKVLREAREGGDDETIKSAVRHLVAKLDQL